MSFPTLTEALAHYNGEFKSNYFFRCDGCRFWFFKVGNLKKKVNRLSWWSRPEPKGRGEVKIQFRYCKNCKTGD